MLRNYWLPIRSLIVASSWSQLYLLFKDARSFEYKISIIINILITWSRVVYCSHIRDPHIDIENSIGLVIMMLPKYLITRSISKQYSFHNWEVHTVIFHETTRSSLSLSSALDGVGWSTPHPGRFYLREWLGKHCTGECVRHRTGLDGYGKCRLYRDSIPGPSSP